PPPAQNEFVRVEQAKPVQGFSPPPVLAKNDKLAKPTPLPKGKRGKKQTPAPKATPAPAMLAQKPGAPSPTPITIASARTPPPGIPNIPAVTPAPTPKAPEPAIQPVAQAPSVPAATPVPVLPAQPAPAETANVALASNAGGGSWKTFPPGKMPLGRLIGTGDLRDVADRGLAGERIYLKGQFVVNFSDANKAVMRPRAKLRSEERRVGKEGMARRAR